MKCSIVMATYNRAPLLERVLESIRVQTPTFAYELIVVDDGSADDTEAVCDRFNVQYHYLDRPGYCNPTAARNVGYRAAQGEVIIAQSSDTLHERNDTVELLCEIEPRTFNIATVRNQNKDGSYGREYTGRGNQRPFFFLGSLFRRDLYGIGGDDEDFKVLGCDDDWFADRLVNGRGLKPVYRDDIVGCHLWHERPKQHWDDQYHLAMDVLNQKRTLARSTGDWVASGGAWS